MKEIQMEQNFIDLSSSIIPLVIIKVDKIIVIFNYIDKQFSYHLSLSLSLV